MKQGVRLVSVPIIWLGALIFDPRIAGAEHELERVVDLREVAHAAARSAPAVQTAQRRAESAGARLDAARGSYWPTLDLEGNVSLLRQRQASELPNASELKTLNNAARGVA